MKILKYVSKGKENRSLKSQYYIFFIMLIVIPILVVLGFVLLFLNRQFGQRGIDNIKQAQETVISELQNEIKNSSIKLSHLVHVNDNEIVTTAAKIDGATISERYDHEKKMKQAVNFTIEPIKDIVSVAFYMNSGNSAFFRNDIGLSDETLRQEEWFRKAGEDKNKVYVGSYNIGEKNPLYQNGERNTLILVYALSPDNLIDREGKVGMICAYQVSKAAERIKKQNAEYLGKETVLGITRIIDQNGRVVYEDQSTAKVPKGSIDVKTPFTVNDQKWYVQSFVGSAELTRDFSISALVALLAAVLILLLAAYFSRFFLSGIVRPVENMRGALKQVEDGNLGVRVEAEGTHETRMMSHQFNAMTRRLENLIAEYEEQVNARQIDEEELFAKLIRGEIDTDVIKRKSKALYDERFVLLFIRQKNSEIRITGELERNPRFISRCMYYEWKPGLIVCYYRVDETEYEARILRMIEDLQKSIKRECGEAFAVCISEKYDGMSLFPEAFAEGSRYINGACLMGEEAVINLSGDKQAWAGLFDLAEHFENLAEAVYAVDEKNVVLGRSELFEKFTEQDIEGGRALVCAVIIALERQFDRHQARFEEVFGREYNYIEKLERITTIRNLKLWVTNYFAWIMDYSSTKLNINENDVIIKAKRYIANNYDNPDLKLRDVAEHIGLNEKYFTNRFSKEAGETFSGYVAGIRVEKAKELLKTTDFKIYEIAGMVGYHSAEHFTRVFKKTTAVSPNQYRKSKERS